MKIERVDVGEALALLERVTRLFETLWTSGSLHALLNTPEGRTAAETWDKLSAQIGERLGGARADGAGTIDLMLEVPGPAARTTLTFVQALMQRGRVAGDLSDDDIALGQVYLDQALAGVAAAGF